MAEQDKKVVKPKRKFGKKKKLGKGIKDVFGSSPNLELQYNR